MNIYISTMRHKPVFSYIYLGVLLFLFVITLPFDLSNGIIFKEMSVLISSKRHEVIGSRSGYWFLNFLFIKLMKSSSNLSSRSTLNVLSIELNHWDSLNS